MGIFYEFVLTKKMCRWLSDSGFALLIIVNGRTKSLTKTLGKFCSTFYVASLSR